MFRCLSLVSNWRDSLDDSSSEYQLASNAQQTLFVYHCQASCELALTKHGCNTPDARNLMMKPDALINHLYQHPSIVARFYEPGGKYPGDELFVTLVVIHYFTRYFFHGSTRILSVHFRDISTSAYCFMLTAQSKASSFINLIFVMFIFGFSS